MRRLRSVCRRSSLIALAMASCAIGVVGTEVDDAQRAIRVLNAERLDEAAPEFALVDRSGASLALRDLREHPVVLHFWATWCEPCRRELPALVAAAARLPRETRLVAVGIDDAPLPAFPDWVPNAGIVVAFARSGDITSRYWTWGIPVTYLIDRSGALRFRMRGTRDWSNSGAADALRVLIETTDRRPD